MRLLVQTVCLGVALGALGSSCDWQKLDKAVERAPVLSLKAPGGYLGGDVGRLVIALPPPAELPEVSARFFVASVTKVAAAVVDLDATGKATVHNVPDSVLFPLTSSPIGSVALATRPDEAFPSVLLGVPLFKTGEIQDGAVFRLKIQPGPVFVLESGILPQLTLARGFKATEFNGLAGFGRGVASGHVSGNPDFHDWVLVGNAGVSIIEDGAGTTPAISTPASLCELDLNPLRLDHLYRFSRTPAIADLIATPGGEVAVGVPDATSFGKVVILTREVNAMGAPTIGCPVSIKMPGVPGFGASVVAGDVNGDPSPDLVVGAPPDKVFVFFGPFVPGIEAAPAFVITAPVGAQTADFGARVALMELDGMPGNEVMVAAPGLAVGSASGAGGVFAFKANGTPVPGFVTVSDHDPEANSGLGEGLAVVSFRNAACAPGTTRSVLVAGANEEVFTYFKLPGALPDPRCFPAQ